MKIQESNITAVYPLFDSHTHLQDQRLAGDLSDVLKRAEREGVRYVVCNGTRESDWPRVEELAEENESVLPCFGIHPWKCEGLSKNWLDILAELVQTHKAGIGEIGLDKCVSPLDEELQKNIFKEQLRLAVSLDRPVSIHCIKAWEWLFDVLEKENTIPDKMMMHAYGGSIEIAKRLSDMGCYFSFGGGVLFEKHVKARKVLKEILSERLLIETDSPDMLPPRCYFKYDSCSKECGEGRNEPGNLVEILNGIAEIRGYKTEELREICWNNSMRFFEKLIEL